MTHRTLDCWRSSSRKEKLTRNTFWRKRIWKWRWRSSHTKRKISMNCKGKETSSWRRKRILTSLRTISRGNWQARWVGCLSILCWLLMTEINFTGRRRKSVLTRTRRRMKNVNESFSKWVNDRIRRCKENILYTSTVTHCNVVPLLSRELDGLMD